MGPSSWSVQEKPRQKICWKQFVDRPENVSVHKTLNSSRGVIRCREVSDMLEVEIRDELKTQGVVEVRQKKKPGSLQKFFICATKGENWERKDLSLKALRSTRKLNNNIEMCMKKAKENWIGEQCSEIEENLRKNNRRGHTNWWKTLPLWPVNATVVVDWA